MSLCNLNVNTFSVETCISDLVKISLKKKASSIAIRFSIENRKIQVVDNGIGFKTYELRHILNGETEKNDELITFFEKVNILSKTIIVTSRSESCPRTYVKIANNNGCCRLFEGYHRPSKGTTVTVYDFNSSSWNNGDKINNSICYVISAIALIESQVSFSVRNDDDKNLILNLKQPHSPWEVLYCLEKNQTRTSAHQSTNQIVDESTSNSSPESLGEKASDSRSLKVSSDLLTGDQTDITNNKNLSSPLSEWSDWSYDVKISDNNQSANNHCNGQINNLSNMNSFDENFIDLSQLSVWSDWYYEPKTSNECVTKKRKVRKRKEKKDPHSKFLPVEILAMLPRVTLLADKKIIQSSQKHFVMNVLDDVKWETTVTECSKYFQNVKKIEIDNVKFKHNECRLSANTINHLQILRQINKEFIAAITNENGRKLLIIIDQHAVHERIRYEYLIETYKNNKTQEYYSTNLDKELVISDIDENSLRIIASRKEILHRVGLNIKSIIDSTTCSVDYVPICFTKRIKNYNNDYNLFRLIKNIRLLIQEVARGLAISESILPPVLPITINNVIAGEACHEAIKFGDPLNVKECTLLIQALQDTKGPTRCAHGRPSMIPLMDLSDLKRWKHPTKRKLNFNALKKNVRDKNSIPFQMQEYHGNEF